MRRMWLGREIVVVGLPPLVKITTFSLKKKIQGTVENQALLPKHEGLLTITFTSPLNAIRL